MNPDCWENFGSQKLLTLLGPKKHISIQLSSDIELMRKGPKWFYFEHKWLLYEEFSPFLKQSWQSLEQHMDVPAKLLACQNKQKNWAGERFNNLGKQISILRNSLNMLNHSNTYGDNLLRISELEANIERLALQEEIHWKQRARSN